MINKKLIIIATLIGAISGCGDSKIETSCSMNGLGRGSCQFTNTGTGSGSVCGKIVAQKNFGDRNTSETWEFCSGKVNPSSTSEVKFVMPNMDDVCPHISSYKWSENCDFHWQQKP